MHRRERPIVLVDARDAPLRRLVAGALRSEGFTTADGGRFREPVDAVAELHPDAVVVEAGIGETERGRELCDQAGAESIPVLWLGRRPGSVDAVEALDHSGADAYLAPPFDPVELGARVRALVRRRGMAIATGTRRVGLATVDLDRREVRLDGVPRPLGRTDWAVLARLLESEGVPVPHDVLLADAFGSPYRDELARLRASVRRLRRALGVRAGERGVIATVRGIGYRVDGT